MEKNKVKKSWTSAEVENYTKKLLSSAELSLAEQRDRISELKRQNDKLTKDYQDLKSREKMISSALTEASRKAREIEELAKVKAEIEIEKVKQFSYKWNSHFEELAVMHPEYAGKSVKKQFNSEIRELIDQIFEVNNLKSDGKEKTIKPRPKLENVSTQSWLNNELKNKALQTAELSKDNESRYNKIISKIKEGMIYTSELKKPNESGFDIEEALNPALSLDEILGDILKK